MRCSLAFLLCAGCATGAALRASSSAIEQEVKTAREQNAESCAPRELAAAEANLDFARLALDQGDAGRAREHLDLAAGNARDAVARSKDCGKVTVVIKQPEKPVPRVTVKDTDGDGIPDVEDLCPDVPGPRANGGCPVLTDKDGDGVSDDIDRCPDVPGPRANFGCPWPDRDRDGVADKDDQCPDLPGPATNNGCPRPQKLVVVRRDRIELRQQVGFAANRSVILRGSHELLRQVARALKDAPGVTVRIEGHTDNVGRPSRNLKLSQARAEAVKAFLVGQGVEPGRIAAEGFGHLRPIASNANKAGRSANRRVEFRITEGAR